MSDDLSREIIYGRGDDLRIFISSRMGTSLDAERQVAAKTVAALAGHRPWLWEDHAAAGTAKSDDECVYIAGTSDGLVLLLADDLTEITKREYFAAKQGGAQRYVMIKTPGALGDEARNLVDAERKASVVTRNFSSDKELKTHLQRSLMAAFVKASRESQARRREVEMGSTADVTESTDE